MQTCKTCKTCKHYKVNEMKSRCCSPKVHYGYNSPLEGEEVNLVVENDEGWGMVPSPDFGCINHEVIEDS